MQVELHKTFTSSPYLDYLTPEAPLTSNNREIRACLLLLPFEKGCATQLQIQAPIKWTQTDGREQTGCLLVEERSKVEDNTDATWDSIYNIPPFAMEVTLFPNTSRKQGPSGQRETNHFGATTPKIMVPGNIEICING